MADVIREVEETTVRTDAPVQASHTVTAATGTVTRAAGPSTAERVIYYLTAVLLTLLAFRFVLSLLGANKGNGFANAIYGVTYPFVAPFFGLFGYNVQYGVARFEIETLVAAAVYGLVGYGVAKLVRIGRKSA